MLGSEPSAGSGPSLAWQEQRRRSGGDKGCGFGAPGPNDREKNVNGLNACVGFEWDRAGTEIY